jgi:predicted RNA-binding Zn ribbon-like protein
MYDVRMDQRFDWPEPGGRDPAPDPELHFVQDFVNTIDIESERDVIGTPDKLTDWLAAQGWLERAERIDAVGHARAIAVREGLRALGRANNGEPLDLDRLQDLNRAAAAVPMVASLTPGSWALNPAGTGLDRYLARVLGSVLEAMADGSWSRLKSCRNDICRWLFFDRSRNRSGTWCTMAVCGSRMKSRAYRARLRESAGA